MHLYNIRVYNLKPIGEFMVDENTFKKGFSGTITVGRQKEGASVSTKKSGSKKKSKKGKSY